jgi:hypothetical protein
MSSVVYFVHLDYNVQEMANKIESRSGERNVFFLVSAGIVKL